MFGREHGSKVGSGGANSALAAEMHRKAQIKSLTLDKIDVSKDPYIVKNHLGSYDCRLCMTTHPTEGNYLAHTKGKRHLAGLARRAARDAQMNQGPQPLGSNAPGKSNRPKFAKKAKIGRPVYRFLKQHDPDSDQNSLLFMVEYPEIVEGIQPRVRILSAFEQRIERTPEKNWQYLLFAAEPYHTICFKIPNLPIEREFDPSTGRLKFWTHWDTQKKIFSLQLYFQKAAPSNQMDTSEPQDDAAFENPEM